MSRHIKLRPRFETLLVPSKLTDHTISIGSGITASELTRSIADLGAQRVVIVTDSNIAPLHSKKLQQQLSKERAPVYALHQVVIDAGETSKNAQTLFEMIDTFDDLNLSRKSDLIVSFGGGVVSDIAGFAASIYKRGIPIVHIPTTLIGQVDAAIGGKTGIDHKSMKNSLGSFYAPKRVIIDPIYLQTLPKRELHSGIGELLKYALIGNPELWQRLSKMIRRLLRGLDPGYELLIREAVKEKLKYVSADEFERASGVRELLNFGHTFGHAFESATGFSTLLHGEAVVLGMRAAAWLSMSEGLLAEDEWREIEVVLGRVPIPTIEFDPLEIVNLMAKDKKQQSSAIRLVLLRRIGSAMMYDEAKPARIKEAIEFINSVS
jgi:3-dehydroquinate synthase